MILRNPTGRKKKAKGTSAAVRAKISRAVKAAARRRKTPARAVARRASRAITIVAPMARRSRRRVARVSRSVARVARRSFRRVRRGVSTGFTARGIFSRENLTIAGGAFVGAYLTSMVLNKFSFARLEKDPTDATKLKEKQFTLPFTQPDANGNVYGEAFYGLAIPVAGAYLVRRTSPAAAKGMVILGVFNVFNTVVNMFTAKPKMAVAAPTAKQNRYMGEYVKYSPRDTKPAITFGNPPGYMATNVTGRVGSPYDSAAAFAKAW